MTALSGIQSGLLQRSEDATQGALSVKTDNGLDQYKLPDIELVASFRIARPDQVDPAISPRHVAEA